MPIAFPLHLVKNSKFGHKTFISNQPINMSREQKNRQDQIRIFGEITKGCSTDNQIIDFFDSSKEAFFTDSNESSSAVDEDIPKDLDDGLYVYANMKNLEKRSLKR